MIDRAPLPRGLVLSKNAPSHRPQTRTRSYAGSSARLLAETRSDGRSLTYTYDAAGRQSGYALWSGSAWATWGGWGYEAATGRMSGVSTPQGWAAASYGDGTDWLATMSYGAVTTTRTPDALRRLQTIKTEVGGLGQPALPSPLFSHTYLYDAAGRRTKATQGDGNFWSYGYDEASSSGGGATRNQVTSGVKRWTDNALVPGMARSYRYDAIGNRASSSESSTGTGAGYASWSANALNQLTFKSGSNKASDVLGEAAPAATVRVNSVNATTRRGAFFHRNVPFSYSMATGGSGSYSLGHWQQIDVEETVAGNAPTQASGLAWLSPQSESFGYDFDGNLTSDGRFSYTWDGENRLVQAVAKTPGGPVAGPVEKLVLRYDSEGRRTEKEVWRKNAAGVFEKQSHAKYDYDGWNLIAETVAEPTAFALKRTYHWGLDLSGTRQGAGGVGGLLVLNDHTPQSGGSHLYAYDGNGNVMGLLNVSDPAEPVVSARYEHGAFGEPLRATGAMAGVNPFRFSTKYQDAETRLLYYGYRYYQATTGRWVNRDPIEEEGGLNLYGMVHNSPTDNVDLLGQIIVTTEGEEYRYAVLNALEKVTGVEVIWCPDGVEKNKWFLCKKTKDKVKTSPRWDDLNKGIESRAKQFTLSNKAPVFGGGADADGSKAGKSSVNAPITGDFPAAVEDGKGGFVKQQSPFEVVLWHELVGHGIFEHNGHPTAPWNIWAYKGKKPAGWGTQTDPVVVIENQARKALNLPLRRTQYFDEKPL